VFCWITAAGLKLLASIDAPVDQAGEDAFASFNESEIRALITQLERLRQTLNGLLELE
jgi:DNA-binding MarR family transcriptional regulator